MVGPSSSTPWPNCSSFDGVSLREPGSTRLLLEEVTLSIKAGQRVGLVGADDLEKYAVIYLIPRLLDPTTGEIRVDDHNLRWVTLDSLRNQIGDRVAAQSHLPRLDCETTSVVAIRRTPSSRSWRPPNWRGAHQFIQKLSQGYETAIGELGHSLTVSQQFRIALARAILRDPALLIIEEPSIEIDDETKDLLDDTMSRVLPGRTTIFIPHRISTLRTCDKTVSCCRTVKIVASGSHKELLATSTLYRHLYYLEFNEVGEQ